MNDKTVIFVYNRNGPHPLHKKYGISVNAYFQVEDFILPWSKNPNSSSLKRYLSWILCGLFFPISSETKYIISDCIRFPLYFRKILRIRRSKEKIIGFLDDETLYFLYSGYYTKRAEKYTKQFLLSCDGLLVVGQMQTEILLKILGSNTPKYKTIINGVNDQRYGDLTKLHPSFKKFRFVTIANGPGGFRIWYKGLDLMLGTLAKLHKTGRSFEYLIIGKWDQPEIDSFYSSLPQDYRDFVKFVGEKTDFSTYLNGSSFYFHCARGETWGISVIEGMASGLIPIVSVYTGSKEAVSKISAELVVELKEEAIYNKIIYLTTLPEEALIELSNKSKEIAGSYLESKSINIFRENFHELTKEIE
jgi:glycosyltransferase involved in cell wall biosynthesis